MKLLVLSIDAMFSEDLERLREHPLLEPFFAHCLIVREMSPVYPALTYPCHASIISGNPPAVHGVYHNTECAPDERWKCWKWYYNAIRCPTLFDYFHQVGYTISAVFWPVTAQAPVDYLVPEIWSYTEDPVETMKRTSGGAANHIIERHRADVDFTSKFKLDRFAKDCALDIVDQFDLDVLFLHLSLVDSTRHRYGIRHPEVDRAVDQCVQWLVEVLKRIEEKKPLEELSLAVLGDHGHLNCRGRLSINRCFAQRGWLGGPPEQMGGGKVFAVAAGISAQVYVRDSSICSQLERMLEELKADGWLYDWYTWEQAVGLGLDGPFAYVLEAGEGYYFTDRVEENFFSPAPAKDGGPCIGKHGHFPTRGDKPPFFLSHRGITSKQLRNHSILDIAPTLCALFQLPGGEMQGVDLLQCSQSNFPEMGINDEK